jgi:hypothetical protein
MMISGTFFLLCLSEAHSFPLQSSITNMPESEGPSLPVIFNSPGLKSDVRLTVFKQEFHVHSAVLKLYSAFFRTFLDSPDKSPAPASALFRYDYVSVIDDDGGGWRLKVASCTDDQPFSILGEDEELVAFGKLLCAMYNKNYSITNFAELSIMTRLADFFCALPILSTSLYIVLWSTPWLPDEIAANCKSALIISQKLHHPLLFREALVHVVSQWRGSSVFLEDYPDLIAVVTSAYNRVCERLLLVSQALLSAISVGNVLESITNLNSELDSDELPTQNAHFYRRLYTTMGQERNSSDAKLER